MFSSGLEPGCRNFNVGLRVPAADVEHVDKFFADHKAFMDRTHKASGDAEPRPLMYAVTKAQTTTGNTLYSVTQTYRGMDGAKAHMAAGQADGPLNMRFLDVFSKFGTFHSVAAEVVHTMSDPLASAFSNVKPGCRSFNLGFAVPDADVADVDVFFANHKAFMDETHFTTGSTEPKVLFYTVTKTPELKDPSNLSSGSTGKTLYSLTEIYRNMKSCEAHMAVGQAAFTQYTTWPPPPSERGRVELGTPTFLEMVDKFAVHRSMMAEVVHTMK
jgi:hypothetical protein